MSGLSKPAAAATQAFLARLEPRHVHPHGMLPLELHVPGPEDRGAADDAPVRGGFMLPPELRGLPDDQYELYRGPGTWDEAAGAYNADGSPMGWRLTGRGRACLARDRATGAASCNGIARATRNP